MISSLSSPPDAARPLPSNQSTHWVSHEHWDTGEPEPTTEAPATLAFSIKPLPPFRLDLTAWTLRRRPSNAIDRWDGKHYRRVLVLNNSPFEVAVAQSGSADRPHLRVRLTGSQIVPEAKLFALTTL